MRKKILYAQEFGGGLGHLMNLASVARGLRDTHAVFALPPASMAAEILQAAAGADVEILDAPAWTAPPPPPAKLDHTLADAMHRMGLGRYPALLAHARAWQELVKRVEPDLIVADFALTQRLAAPPGVPQVTIGNWYAVPPPGRTLPPVRHWENYLPPASQRRERELLAAANAVRAQLGFAPLAFWADLFHGERSFVTAFDGFDAYARYRTEPNQQPYQSAVINTGPALAQRQGPHVYAYLSRFMRGLNSTLTALNGLPLPVHVYVHGVEPAEVAAQAAPQVSVHVKPPDFGLILPQSRLFIHHGGGGSSYGGLLAGVPQLMLADGLEQQGNAYGVAALGCGQALAVDEDADPGVLRGMIGQMLADGAMQARTLEVSRELVAQRDPDPARKIVAACRELMG